jgi:hypothetical protein
VQEFQACTAWRSLDHLTPERIDPQAFLEDHLRLLREGEIVDDDLIRGACPGQVAIPWLPGIADCRVRVFPDSILGEERCLSLDEVASLALERDGPWFRKYVEFGLALVAAADGRFPVSHAASKARPGDWHGEQSSPWGLAQRAKLALGLLSAGSEAHDSMRGVK